MHYFDHETRFAFGPTWYRQRWHLHASPSTGAPSPQTIGVDGSGTYFHSPDAAIRLSASLPSSTRLLLLLRDPVSRAVRMVRITPTFPSHPQARTHPHAARDATRETYKPLFRSHLRARASRSPCPYARCVAAVLSPSTPGTAACSRRSCFSRRRPSRSALRRRLRARTVRLRARSGGSRQMTARVHSRWCVLRLRAVAVTGRLAMVAWHAVLRLLLSRAPAGRGALRAYAAHERVSPAQESTTRS